jgi:hypothetical protein
VREERKGRGRRKERRQEGEGREEGWRGKGGGGRRERVEGVEEGGEKKGGKKIHLKAPPPFALLSSFVTIQAPISTASLKAMA